MFLFTLSVRRLRSQLGLMPTSIPPTTPYRGMSELIGIIFGVNLHSQLSVQHCYGEISNLLFIVVCVDAGSHPRHLLVGCLSPEPDVTATLQVAVEEHVAVADRNLVNYDEVQVHPV